MTAPPPALRRAAALVLLATLLAVPYLAVMAPLVEAWQTSGRDLARATETLGRMRATVDGGQALEQALASRDPSGRIPGHYRAASETLVAAQIQDRLRNAVDKAGGTMSSVKILPAGEAGPFRRIGLRVQVDARLANLQALLHDLEGGRPLLIVQSLSVRAPHRPGPEMRDPVLDVQMDLFAFARIGGP